jgi:hypothetical protein
MQELINFLYEKLFSGHIMILKYVPLLFQYTFRLHIFLLAFSYLKVHKNENFFGFDFEFCTISLLAMSKY